jgi:protease-4
MRPRTSPSTSQVRATSAALADRLRRAIPGVRAPLPAGRVAVMRLHGPITGARAAEWLEVARRLRESKRVPAVVLDIDSPGGSATASDDLYLGLQRLAEKKPLVSAIRGVGASGAYLAAMASRRIVANPNAIVGSIGVISAGPRLPRLLDRLGVSVSVTKAGRLKEMGAPWREDTDEERVKEEQLIGEIYDAFVGRVVAGRRLSEARVRELATGEVWLGGKALELGLIDEIGDLERSIEIAAEMAGVPARSTPVHLRRPLISRLADRFAVSLASAVADEIEVRLADRIRLRR